MSLLDRAIAAVSPRWAASRAEALAKLAAYRQITAHYDAATRTHRTGGRRITGTSANAEIVTSLARLRNVSRELGRNNPYVARVFAAIPSDTVGAGILPSIITKRKRLKAALGDLVVRHLDTPAIDVDGRLNLYGIEAQVMRTVVESGEALIVRYVPPSALRLPVPLQVRVLEPDYLDASKDGPLPNGAVAFQGIEIDVTSGRRVAYWLYDAHPGGNSNWRLPISRRVPASEVIHVYRADRPGQMRGVPWAAPIVLTAWDLADYEDAELMRQKIAACFAVFWTGDDPADAVGKIKGETRAGNPIEALEPGLIQRLPSGADVKFATPPIVQGYDVYTRTQVRKVATGFGVPYEVASGDHSQVSFISGRLGRIQYDRSIDQWRWHMLIPHACAGIGEWFLAAASIALSATVDDVRLDWTPPRKEMVEPRVEIPAARDAIRAGLSSRSEELRMRGLDPEQIDQENADDNARADAAGLKYDSDGRYPATQSIADATAQDTTNQDTSDGQVQPAG